MTSYQENHDNVFHERTKILVNKGYQGFTISSVKRNWDRVKVIASNHAGKTVTATGETNEEAYKKIIDSIDLFLEER